MNTPRTDAFEKQRIVEATTNDIATEAWADFARQLERENERLREALEGMLENYIVLKDISLVMARSDAPNWIGRNLTAEGDIHVIAARKALAAQPEETK